jgi:hypothetical protein
MIAATNRHLVAEFDLSYIGAMLKFEGAALLGEVIATVWLLIALVGFSVRRTTPWLICASFAAAMLLITVVMIVDATSA